MAGNAPGIRDPGDFDIRNETHHAWPRRAKDSAGVETWAAKAKKMHPLVLPKLPFHTPSSQEFCDLQSSCPSLETIRRDAALMMKIFSRDDFKFIFEYINGLLYKTYCDFRVKDRIGSQS